MCNVSQTSNELLNMKEITRVFKRVKMNILHGINIKKFTTEMWYLLICNYF